MTGIAQQRIEELRHEHIEIVAYDPRWSEQYNAVEMRLSRSLPSELVTRIAHIGSTAVPGLSAKPIIDVQVEVRSLDRVRREAVPIMRELGYEYIWRPTMGERAPFYAWFILRDASGTRIEHVHMVEPDSASEARLLFRDYLRAHPEEARRYEALKHELHAQHAGDRVAYTTGKTSYIAGVVALARQTDRT